MAKHNQPTSKVPMQYVKLGLVAWDHEKVNTTRHTRRSKQERDYLRYCLARDGWNVQLGVIPVFDKSSPIWSKYYQEILDKCYETRVLQYKSLLDNPQQPDLDVFEALFTEETRSGERQVIKPVMLANACHGRLEEIVGACIVRKSGKGYAALLGKNKNDENADFPPQEVQDTYPVHLFQFDTEAERTDEQIMENEGKLRGNKEVSPADKMRNIFRGFSEFGWNQKKVRDVYKGTFGQRGYLIARADQLWSDHCPKADLFSDETERPSLGIREGCFIPSTKDGHVPFQSLNDMTALTEIVNRSYPDGLDKVNEKIDERNLMRAEGTLSSPVEKVKRQATAEEIKDFFQGGGGAKSADKMLDKSTWKNLSGSECHIIKDLAEVALNNDTSKVALYVQNKDIYNDVRRLVNEGEKSKLTMALALLEHPQFEEIFNAAMPHKKVKIEVLEEETVAS